MRKEKYEGHLSNAHGAPKRYQCPLCGKQFALNSDLFKHRAQVHITKPKLPFKGGRGGHLNVDCQLFSGFLVDL